MAASPVKLSSSVLGLVWAVVCASAQPFQFPTANRALLQPGGDERFFVGTVGKPVASGRFGCVRSEGWQMHEGLDIRCLQRDARGEPTDPVLATADGTIAYINRNAALSTFGKYLVIRHVVEGVEVFSNYAHLSEIPLNLRAGQTVKAGQRVATMGRTANTAQSITKDRAHVHFELNLLAHDQFARWYARANPKQRNDHGGWNGFNLLGLDPRLIFLGQAARGTNFSLLQFIRSQPELFRVQVRDTHFPWVRRYPMLIARNPAVEREGLAGYELVFNYNGVPFQAIQRTHRELKSRSKVLLLSVNAEEYRRNPCRKLVVRRGGQWQLTRYGSELIDLLTF